MCVCVGRSAGKPGSTSDDVRCRPWYAGYSCGCCCHFFSLFIVRFVKYKLKLMNYFKICRFSAEKNTCFGSWQIFADPALLVC